MKNLRFWILFGACSIAWLLASLWMAPSMSGGDVFIFRDAGWNLAAYGRFESAGLLYMHDLTPRPRDKRRFFGLTLPRPMRWSDCREDP